MSKENQISSMMGEYLTVHQASKYNNRRNKLRELADLMFGFANSRFQDRCHELVKDLLTFMPELAEKGLKPTFNSFRSRLSPAVLEEFCVYVYSKSPMAGGAMDVDTYDVSVSHWVRESVNGIGDGDYPTSPWGTNGLSSKHEERLSEIIDQFLLSGGNKKEIKNVQGAAPMAATNQIVLDDNLKVAVDAILGSLGVSVDSINKTMNTLTEEADLAQKENTLLAGRLSVALSTVNAPTSVSASSDGTLPDGDVVMTIAKDIFTEITDKDQKKTLEFDVPVFEWSGVHPDVPTIDPNYEYDVKALFRVLQGIVDSNNTYLFGHTGTGKSTLVEQVCARLNFPLVRVNFDSEISRMDLVGRDTLVQENGQTVSKFVDGVLPDALSRPCLLLCDEVDFIRPDVMYVFQRVLEGNGLLISEDGGRKVIANPWFRLIATANTVGQGDDTAMYQGARPQSMATLDRFENWVEMGYMTKGVETQWLKGVTAGLKGDDAKTFIKYAKEHREAFTSGMVMQPLSPRGLRAMAKRYVTVLGLTNNHSQSIREAFDATVLARCTQQDKTVLDGLYQRVYG
jgi:cobaltochelatase CobS